MTSITMQSHVKKIIRCKLAAFSNYNFHHTSKANKSYSESLKLYLLKFYFILTCHYNKTEG